MGRGGGEEGEEKEEEEAEEEEEDDSPVCQVNKVRAGMVRKPMLRNESLRERRNLLYFFMAFLDE